MVATGWGCGGGRGRVVVAMVARGCWERERERVYMMQPSVIF